MDTRLTQEEINQIVNGFKDFFGTDSNIIHYYLKKKFERVEDEFDTSDLFNDFTMNPMDMDISFEVIDSNVFTKNCTHIATFPIESQIGRRLNIGVKENNTGKFIGFVRIASPVSSIRPRNEFFGVKNLPLKYVNPHIYNGQTIVPVQPFGYNYLGGKLLSMICISNEMRELYNQTYDTNVMLFETTSLYGNSKSSSMYDGLEPYIKFMGLTESSNLLFPTDEVYNIFKNIMRSKFGKEEFDGRLTRRKGSSPKTREFLKGLSILKNHLTEEDKKDFNTFMKNNMESKEQKRFYLSTMGFTNVREHILNGEPLKEQNRDKYDLNQIVERWKIKSQKRFDKLKSENNNRIDLEIYTKETIKNGLNFNIIR